MARDLGELDDHELDGIVGGAKSVVADIPLPSIENADVPANDEPKSAKPQSDIEKALDEAMKNVGDKPVDGNTVLGKAIESASNRMQLPGEAFKSILQKHG